MLLQHFEPIFEKVFPKRLILGVIRFQQCSEETSDFFCFMRQGDGFA
jgi:hypothetical protein